MVFSEEVLDHFQSPRNQGPMSGADAEATDENPVCGDRLHLWLRIQDGRIVEATWQAAGCAPAIAAASALSEMVRGSAVGDARSLKAPDLVHALGGLPPRKAHAAALALSALRKALDSYDTSPRQADQ